MRNSIIVSIKLKVCYKNASSDDETVVNNKGCNYIIFFQFRKIFFSHMVRIHVILLMNNSNNCYILLENSVLCCGLIHIHVRIV